MEIRSSPIDSWFLITVIDKLYLFVLFQDTETLHVRFKGEYEVIVVNEVYYC